MHKSELLMRLGVLFAGFPNAKPMEPTLAWEAYGRPLSTIEDWAVINTLERFQRGEVEGQSVEFPPAISALVSEARRLVAEKARRDKRDAPRLPWRHEVSPEERSRVSAKMAKLAAELQGRLNAEEEGRMNARRAVLSKTSASALGDPRSLRERLRIDELVAGA